MTAQTRRRWREKLDFLLAQEAIKAGSAERFELGEQIAECRAKLAELDEEDQRRRDAAAAPLAPTPAPPLAPTHPYTHVLSISSRACSAMVNSCTRCNPIQTVLGPG